MEFKEAMAANFAVIMKRIREKQWTEFCEKSEELDEDPYSMLGRVLVESANDQMEQLWTMVREKLIERARA